MTRVLLLVLVALALVPAACGTPCRGIETRELAFECAATTGFTGELHFDSEATFDTFLRQQCFAAGDDGDADAILEDIDFTTEAVFVATGPDRLDESRCLVSRELDEAQVCATGLKVYFRDELRRDGTDCPGTRWTVAFVMPREDLRAAIEAGRENDPFGLQ